MMESIKPPRIAMVIDRYFPLWGGTENQLRQMLPHLGEQGCQAFVVTRRWDQTLTRKELVDGTEVHRIGLPGKGMVATFAYVAGVFWVLFRKRYDFDIIHSNGAAALGVLGSLYGFLLTKKNVVRISSAGRVPALANSPAGFLALPFLRRSSAIISLCEAITRELTAIGIPKERIHTISNGVSCDRFRRFPEEERRSWRIQRNLPPDARVILFASLFKPGKGHVPLLKAWSLVEQKEANCWLVLLGGANYQRQGTTESILTTIKQLQLQRVVLAGESNDTAQYTGIADICAFPAEDDSEGCPNTLLEGMAAQLASVAFNTNGVRDLIRDDSLGLLVNKKDIPGFADNLIDLLRNDTKRQTIALTARNAARRSHSFSAIATRYVQLYGTLLGQSQGPW